MAKGRDAKLAANWVTGDLFGALNKLGNEHRGVAGVAPTRWASCSISSATTRSPAASPRTCSRRCWRPARAPAAIVEEKGLRQVTDTGAIEAAIDAVLAANADKVAEYKSGKDKLFGFFVGQVMKATGGKANPALLNEILRKKLAG